MKDNGLLRDPIKYVRDISKSAYVKDSKCLICEGTENLEFHHYFSLTNLFNAWLKKNKVTIDCVDDILKHRLVFKEDHYQEIYHETVTLCKKHHLGLHKVYGKVPTLFSAEKQKRWVVKQKNKLRLKSEKV